MGGVPFYVFFIDLTQTSSRIFMTLRSLFGLLSAALSAAQYRRVTDFNSAAATFRGMTMLDVYMLALALASFAALFGYLFLCDRL